jgi:Zn-dependent protease/Tfp pilus assembly protein PilF
MKWSLLAGKFWGTEIRLHASLLLLIPYALIVFKPEDLPGALRVLVLIAAIFLCVALHEMGHTLAARLFGIQVSSIVLWPLGGFANLSQRPEKVLPDLVISAAGPLANLALFVGLGLLTIAERLVERSTLSLGLSHLLFRWNVFPLLASLTIANLSLALFNLVPIYPLDGGQIARGVLKLVFGEKWADRILLIVSLPLALALTVAGFFAHDIVIVLTGLLLLLAGATLNTRLLNGMTLGVLYFLDRGGYYLKRMDYDPAIAAYTQAIERNPDRAGLYVSRAVAFMNLLEFPQAQADIDRALARDANSFIAWALHGELHAYAKNYPAALAAFNRAIEIRPTWSIAYLDRGGVYADLNELQQALADMNRSVEHGNGSPVSYVLRGMLRYRMGDVQGAHADADQAMRYAPQWMLVFPEIFLANLEGYLNWSLDYYGRAIERMPNAYQVYQGRADACRANNRPNWAVEDYHRAIHLAPRQAELYLGRGRAYASLGLLLKAAEDFRRAAQLAEKSHIRRQAEALLTWLAKLTEALTQPPSSAGTVAATGQSQPPVPSADSPQTTPSVD